MKKSHSPVEDGEAIRTEKLKYNIKISMKTETIC